MLSQALGESPVHSQSHTCTGATLVPGESTKESLHGDSWEEKRKSPPLQHQPRGSLNQTSIRQHLPETARPPARSQGDGWSQVPDEETGSETVVVQFPPSTNHTHSNKNNNTGYHVPGLTPCYTHCDTAYPVYSSYFPWRKAVTSPCGSQK